MKHINFILTLFFTLLGCSSPQYIGQPSQRIIFFGDSITELGVKPNGYVTIIRDSLASAGYNGEVVGAGVSGNKVTDLLTRIEKDVIAKKPTIVVIYIGINDVWHFEFASRGLSGTPKDKFEAGLKTVIADIQSNGAKVVLCTPSVIGEKNDGSNKYDSLLEAYSEISRRTAVETGSAICDLREIFLNYLRANNSSNKEKDILTYDGVHLNDRGNRLVADNMMKVFDGLGLFFPQK